MQGFLVQAKIPYPLWDYFGGWPYGNKIFHPAPPLSSIMWLKPRKGTFHDKVHCMNWKDRPLIWLQGKDKYTLLFLKIYSTWMSDSCCCCSFSAVLDALWLKEGETVTIAALRRRARYRSLENIFKQQKIYREREDLLWSFYPVPIWNIINFLYFSYIMLNPILPPSLTRFPPLPASFVSITQQLFSPVQPLNKAFFST